MTVSLSFGYSNPLGNGYRQDHNPLGSGYVQDKDVYRRNGVLLD